jgi:hypothetical protein
MWNIVDKAIYLVFGPKPQMLDIVDIAIQVGRARGARAQWSANG